MQSSVVVCCVGYIGSNKVNRQTMQKSSVSLTLPRKLLSTILTECLNRIDIGICDSVRVRVNASRKVWLDILGYCSVFDCVSTGS